MFSICSKGWAQPAPETKGPVIASALAIQEMQYRHCGQDYGSIWKIYIEAEDPDKEMAKIAVSVNQVGYGQLATDWTSVKPQHRHHFKGYLQWDTFGSRDGAHIRLKISVIDRVGNASEEVVFRLTCKSGGEDNSRPGCLLYQSGPPAPFDQGDILRIGHINVNLAYISSPILKS